jgi:hypothetical protein
MDLRSEPIVLLVPAVKMPRSYSVQLIDGNTYSFGYIGSRSTGDEAGDYMVAGPNWKGDMLRLTHGRSPFIWCMKDRSWPYAALDGRPMTTRSGRSTVVCLSGTRLLVSKFIQLEIWFTDVGV